MLTVDIPLLTVVVADVLLHHDVSLPDADDGHEDDEEDDGEEGGQGHEPHLLRRQLHPVGRGRVVLQLGDDGRQRRRSRPFLFFLRWEQSAVHLVSSGGQLTNGTEGTHALTVVSGNLTRNKKSIIGMCARETLFPYLYVVHDPLRNVVQH